MIKDVIYLLMFLLTEFLNYILGYSVIFGMKLNKSKSSWITTIVAIIISHIVLLISFGIEVSCGVSFISMIIIPITLLRPVEIKNFMLYPFIVVGVSNIGVCISFIIAIMFNIPIHYIIDDSVMTVGCQSFSILIMFLFKLYRKFKNKENYEIYLDWKQYIILYAVVISLFLLLAPIQFISRTADNYSDINTIGLAASTASLVLIIVTIWQAISSTKEQYLQERNIMNEKYIGLQKEYYEQLVNHDESMRRFKHDINAHIQVMKALCEDNEKSDLRQYLDTVIKESTNNEVISITGNKTVDVIIRKMLEEAEENQITIDIKGALPEKTKIQQFDLCTLVSNLFKNAIEACEKIDDASKRFIYVELGVYNIHFYMLIKNTVNETVIIKNNYLKTTKVDYKNHGIGTKNILNVVKKYDGMLEYRCEDGWFIAEVDI